MKSAKAQITVEFDELLAHKYSVELYSHLTKAIFATSGECLAISP